MTKLHVRAESLVGVVMSLAAIASAAEAPQLGRSPIADVVAAMTREEKVNLVIGVGMNIPGLGLPPALQPPPGAVPPAVPGAAGATFGIPRLGIPSIVLADGPAGLRIDAKREGETRRYHATAFPIEALVASSWDVAVAERIGAAMGHEFGAYGADVLLAPALNTHRNPLGGRNFEYYSEDPLVAGRMTAALVRGVQSQGIGTSIKHFVANDHEWNRTTINVKVSERALREIYLRPFEIAVREAAPWTVMSSYNKVNGLYTSESPALLTGVLRKEWGFDGLVMTDWFGGRQPVAQMKAGNDLLMPGTGQQQKTLLEALASKALDEKVLDQNLARILAIVARTPKMKGGKPQDAPDLEAGARVSRAAAAEGMVLLKNEQALPLAAPAKVALLGNASYRTFTTGSGSGDVNAAHAVSILDGLAGIGFVVDKTLVSSYKEHLAEAEKKQPTREWFMPEPALPERTIDAASAAALAREADVAVLTIGRRSGEFRDRARKDDFELTSVEQALVKEVAAAFHAQKKKLIVLLNVGGVLETASWRDQPDAILLTWLPGQEAGHAIADVLGGKVAPSGKLATTFPVKWEDVPSSAGFPGKTLLGPDPAIPPGPMRGDREAEVTYDDDIWVGYRHYATKGVKTAYAFGYGLSYTTFKYSDLEVSDAKAGEPITVTVTVTNAGKSAGREIVQLYLSAPAKTLAKPTIELRAFAKTKSLEPGKSEVLSFTI
jgi:beta-glucosidase